MYTCFRSLASSGRSGSRSFVVACALVAASLPTLAQRSQQAQSPSRSATRDVGLACTPHFVGQQLTLGDDPRDLAVVDLDGDGDLDLAVADRDGGITTAFRQRSELVPGATYALSGRTYWLVAGDVDGNGSPDLVACLLQVPQPTVAVLLNQGRGVFAPAVEYATAAEPLDWALSVAIADVDGDGDRDLAVANLDWHMVFDPEFGEFHDTSVALLLNQGNGTFGAPSESAPIPLDSSPDPVYAYPHSVVLADDLDGDGDADLALTAASQDSVFVLENLGTGAFSAPTAYSVDSHPKAIAAADVDGDGDRDLVVGQYESDTFAVLLNQGGGTFAPALSQSGLYSPSSVSSADLDGDGDLDLAFAASAPFVVLNQGSGSFGPPMSVGGHRSPLTLATGDLDGNGTIDLASVNGDTVSLYRNLGDAVFERPPRYDAGPSPRLVANGDVDGDGDRDLVVGTGTQTLQMKVSVLGNLGSGAFAPHVEFAVATRPEALHLADLDHDGLVDVVSGGGSRISVLLNQGDGAFGSLTTFGAGLPTEFTSADLDGDGDLDVAMSLGSTNTLGILPGSANGNVGPLLRYQSGFTAQGITGADFDHDGDVDLALASNDTATARLFDNQGAGNFVLLPGYPAGGNPLAITSADFDRDGHIDLALVLEPATESGSPQVVVLGNTGSGSFVPGALHPVGRQPRGFLQADLDRDSDPDVVVLSGYSDAFSLLRNLGDGTFASHVQVTAHHSSGLTCADLDGDGDMDLASTSESSDTVEIHVNSCRLGNGF